MANAKLKCCISVRQLLFGLAFTCSYFGLLFITTIANEWKLFKGRDQQSNIFDSFYEYQQRYGAILEHEEDHTSVRPENATIPTTSTSKSATKRSTNGITDTAPALRINTTLMPKNITHAHTIYTVSPTTRNLTTVPTTRRTPITAPTTRGTSTTGATTRKDSSTAATNRGDSTTAPTTTGDSTTAPTTTGDSTTTLATNRDSTTASTTSEESTTASPTTVKLTTSPTTRATATTTMYHTETTEGGRTNTVSTTETVSTAVTTTKVTTTTTMPVTTKVTTPATSEEATTTEATTTPFSTVTTTLEPWQERYYGMGCYIHNSGSFITLVRNFRAGIDWYDIGKTVKECADFLREESTIAEYGEAKYFAIKFYGECWMGNDATPTEYYKEGPTDNCYMDKVGSSFSIYVYHFGPKERPAPRSFTSLGCFLVGSGPSLRIQVGNFTSVMDTSVKLSDCAKESLNRGFTHFGLKNHGECWSGLNARDTYNESGVSTNCVDGIGAQSEYDVYEFV